MTRKCFCLQIQANNADICLACIRYRELGYMVALMLKRNHRNIWTVHKYRPLSQFFGPPHPLSHIVPFVPLKGRPLYKI